MKGKETALESSGSPEVRDEIGFRFLEANFLSCPLMAVFLAGMPIQGLMGFG
jgi:hypothetical protein